MVRPGYTSFVETRLGTHAQALADLCKRWRVREMSAFGSVVRQDFRADSDIDVLVRFEPTAQWSAWDLVRMRDELASIFGRSVDLVEADAIRNPFRRRTILAEREVIYAA
jgi:predicted nucleotidyltransferase